MYTCIHIIHRERERQIDNDEIQHDPARLGHTAQHAGTCGTSLGNPVQASFGSLQSVLALPFQRMAPLAPLVRQVHKEVYAAPSGRVRRCVRQRRAQRSAPEQSTEA